MSVTQPPARPGVPPQEADVRKAARDHARVINTINGGHFNCTLIVTLITSSTTTTVVDSRISKLNTAVLMCPTTTSAATEFVSGKMYHVITDGTVIINHTSAATADRTFQMAMIG